MTRTHCTEEFMDTMETTYWHIHGLINAFYDENNISFEYPIEESILYRRSKDSELECFGQRLFADNELDEYLYKFEYNSNKYVDYIEKKEERSCYYYLKLDSLHIDNIEACYMELVYPYTNIDEKTLEITTSTRKSKYQKQIEQELLEELRHNPAQDRELEILRAIHDDSTVIGILDEETYKDYDVNTFQRYIINELLEKIRVQWRMGWKKRYDGFGNYSYVFQPSAFDETTVISVLEKGIDNFLLNIHNQLSLDVINEISNLKYEKATLKGELVFPTVLVEYIINNPNRVINITSKVDLWETRKIRKLLEMTSKQYRLIAVDGHKSYRHTGSIPDFNFVSIGTISPKYLDACFIIKFNGSLEWELYWGKRFILSSSNFRVSLRINNLHNKRDFKKDFYNVFDKKDSNMERVWDIVQAAMQQSKGTILVISNMAENESFRLEDVSFKVNRFKLTKSIVQTVSSIDGAIMVDPKGFCYALGVILDGISNKEIKADSSRGARFNSALRYKHTVMKELYKDKEAKFMIVVVSEDGMVEFI